MEKIFFYNKKKEKICGIFFQSHKKLNLILCHGYQGSKEGGGLALRFAQNLAQTGINTLCFDFSGQGESAGDFSAITLTKQKQDIFSAINYLKTKNNYPIILMGRSLGGTTALLAAAEKDEIGGLITWAAPFVLEKAFTQIEFPVKLAEDFLKQDLFKAAEKISPRPFLILHGEKDGVISVRQSKLLYRTAKEPKTNIIFPNCEHHFPEIQDEIQNIVLQWLQQFLN